jgi:hypothetical protein
MQSLRFELQAICWLPLIMGLVAPTDTCHWKYSHLVELNRISSVYVVIWIHGYLRQTALVTLWLKTGYRVISWGQLRANFFTNTGESSHWNLDVYSVTQAYYRFSRYTVSLYWSKWRVESGAIIWQNNLERGNGRFVCLQHCLPFLFVSWLSQAVSVLWAVSDITGHCPRFTLRQNKDRLI